MSQIVEGLWDCPYCEQKAIGGLTKTCPNCGHPQDAGTKFYLGEQKRVLDKETAANYGKGADWTCSYCGAMNRYNAQECKSCGAPKETSSGDYFQNRKKEEPSGQEVSIARKPVNTPSFTKSQMDSLKKRFFIIGAILAVLLLIFIPKSAKATLDEKSWSREIEVEEYKTVKESDWTLPAGGREYARKEEIHHYNHVIDHYETVSVQKSREVLDGYDSHTEYSDNGDGTFTANTIDTPRYRTEYYTEMEDRPVYVDVPVYQTKYYYEIERWLVEYTVPTSGGDDEPYWGEFTLKENQREGKHNETYTVSFVTKKNKHYSKAVSFDEWKALKVGDQKKLTIQVGTIKKIE